MIKLIAYDYFVWKAILPEKTHLNKSFVYEYSEKHDHESDDHQLCNAVGMQ